MVVRNVNTVVTADLVQSTTQGIPQRRLTEELETVFANLTDFLEPSGLLLPFRVSQGDSFQGVLRGVESSLLAVLYLHCAIRQTLLLDVRQAMGIGATEQIVGESTLTSSGEAFVRSGRLLEGMIRHPRKQPLIAVESRLTEFDEQFNTYFVLFDAIAARWTAKECEAIFLKLHNWNQTEIADHLGISQSAVHKRLRAADWPAVEVLLKRWETVVTATFGPMQVEV